jgi:LysR family cyn operon transcriptional activator
MNLRHLRALVAIAEAGGVARGAARLNLSQPAATRQILALEAELGIPLFDRIGRRVHLTSEGEDLLQRSRRLLSEADAITERARVLKSGRTGVLRLGATPQAIESLLVGFLAQYRRRHPGVEVRLVEDGGARLPGRLGCGDLHLSIMPAGDEGFPSRLLYPMYVLAAMSHRHRLHRRAALDIMELADEPLLLLARGFASRDWFHAACQLAHVRPHVQFESTVPQTLISLAAAGEGVAIVPSTVRMAARTVRAVPIVHRGAPLGRWTVIAWHPQRFLAPYAEAFVTELSAFTRRTYPGREFTRRAPPLPQPQPASSV